jgi:hypothetical protein
MTKAGEARIPQPVSVKIFAPPGVPPTVVPDSVLLSKGHTTRLCGRVSHRSNLR